MPKKAKTGRKSYPWTKAQERRIMALAIKAVRADWAAVGAKYNVQSVIDRGLATLADASATDGGYRLTEVGPLRRDFDPEVDRAEQAFGIAPTPDRSAIIRQMQRWRGDRQGYVALACTRPNPEQIAEGIAAAADHLAQTDPAGGGGQIAPPPSDPASPAAFDAAVAANKAIFSLREAPPFQKNNFAHFPPDPWYGNLFARPPSDTTADGTQSGGTAPAKNENFRWDHHPTVTTGDYHAWTAAREPAVATDELERAMLDDGLIQAAARGLGGGEEFPINDGTALRPVGDHAWDYAKPGPGDPKAPWSDCVFTGDTIHWLGEQQPIFRTDYGRGAQYIRTSTGAVVAVAHMNRASDPAVAIPAALEDFPPNSVWTDEVAAWKGEFHRVLRGDLGRGRRVIRTRSGRVIDVDAAGLTVVPAAQATQDALDPVPPARGPICAGCRRCGATGVWATAPSPGGEVVCSVCGLARLAHPAVPEKTDSPPANTHLGIMPGGRPLGPPKVNGLRTWWETIMTDVEALPLGNQLTLSPWQVAQLYDALRAWGYRSGRKTP